MCGGTSRAIVRTVVSKKVTYTQFPVLYLDIGSSSQIIHKSITLVYVIT